MTGPVACPAPSRRSAWPLERVLFALAGTVTLLSALLAALVSPWFVVLAAFVGVNQWLYVAFGVCPASCVLSRRFGLRSLLHPPEGGPPNQPRRPLWPDVGHRGPRH